VPSVETNRLLKRTLCVLSRRNESPRGQAALGRLEVPAGDRLVQVALACHGRKPTPRSISMACRTDQRRCRHHALWIASGDELTSVMGRAGLEGADVAAPAAGRL
jgi:hypothetical protein